MSNEYLEKVCMDLQYAPFYCFENLFTLFLLSIRLRDTMHLIENFVSLLRETDSKYTLLNNFGSHCM